MHTDDLSASEKTPGPALHELDLMSQAAQFARHVRVDALLEVHRPIQDPALLGRAGADADARRIERHLRVVLEREHVEQHLHVSLGLHEAPHDAVHGVEAPVTGQGHHGRDDGVVWPLARRETVRVVWVQGEVGAPVVKREATTGGDDAGPEPAVVAVDEGHAVAPLVRHRKVDGIAVIVCRRAML